MDWLNQNAGATQAIATIVLVVLTAVYATISLVIARHAGRQVDELRRGSQAQALTAISAFLQAEDVREARTKIRNMERPEAWEREWSTHQKQAAALVCSSYEAAAMLVVSGLLDAEPFTTAWGPSILHCYDVCEPYVLAMRARGSGSTYWGRFEAVARAYRRRSERHDLHSWSSDVT